MQSAFDLVGISPRWSRYQIQAGRIAPNRKSEFQALFDPWVEFRENAEVYRTVARPYVPMLALGKVLGELHRKGVQTSGPFTDARIPTTEADEALLAFANQFGLLGILPCLSDRICIPGSRRSLEHRRIGGIWTGIETSHTEHASGKQGRAVFRWWRWDQNSWVDKPLHHLWAYFPNVGDPQALSSTRLPRPGTERFFRWYAEPLDEFAQWVSWFSTAVESLSIGDRPDAEIDGFELLRGLAAGAMESFFLNTEKQSIQQVRVSPGLLSSFALMYLWDRVEGYRVIYCENCGKPFVSNDRLAAYCRVACRNSANSRRYRERKKERESNAKET